jgi:hypothetical protein
MSGEALDELGPELQLVQVDPLGVGDEDGRQRCNEAWGLREDECLPHCAARIVEPLAREDVAALLADRKGHARAGDRSAAQEDDEGAARRAAPRARGRLATATGRVALGASDAAHSSALPLGQSEADSIRDSESL